MKLHSLVIRRYKEKDGGLISKWFLNGEHICYGVENADKAITKGVYMATMSYSPRFKEYLYELSSVPGRKEILLHVANNPDELAGCLAPGMKLGRSKYAVLNSRDALKRLHIKSKGLPLVVSVIEDY